MRRVIILLFCFSFASTPVCVLAATIQLGSGPSQISTSDEYTIPVSLTIGSDATYYLRGVFYQPGSTNYCGYTWNGASWYNGPYTANNGWMSLFAIQTVDSSWSGTLKAKIDPTDSGCSSSGSYLFKVERYTSGGSGTFDTQNEQTVNVVIPTPTPTLVPTVPPTLIPTPTKLPPTSIPTITPALKTPTNIPTVVHPTEALLLPPTEDVLAASSGSGSEDSTFAPSLSPPMLTMPSHAPQSKTTLPWQLILGGGILIVTCGILSWLVLHGDSHFIKQRRDPEDGP